MQPLNLHKNSQGCLVRTQFPTFLHCVVVISNAHVKEEKWGSHVKEESHHIQSSNTRYPSLLRLDLLLLRVRHKSLKKERGMLSRSRSLGRGCEGPTGQVAQPAYYREGLDHGMSFNINM